MLCYTPATFTHLLALAMRLVVLLAATLLVLPVRAQTPVFAEGGARSLGMAGAGTALAGDLWGHANPASWATLEGRSIGLFASQSFMLDEMRLAGFMYAEPLRWLTAAAGALEQPRHPLRRADLDDLLDRRKIHPEVQRRRAHDADQLAPVEIDLADFDELLAEEVVS